MPTKIKTLYILLLSMFALMACTDDSSSAMQFPSDGNLDTLRSTTLVYMMAENNLNRYSQKDLDEMYKGAIYVPRDCGMFAFVDDINLPRILRFYNNAGVPVCETVYTFDDDFCSSDIEQMRNVLDLLQRKYPTRELNLVLWSHGNGWLKDNKRETMQRTIGFDNGLNSSSGPYPSQRGIEIAELSQLLESREQKPCFLMFDACFMQCIEVIYELRNSAKWIIASPAEIPAYGAPYNKLIPHFFSQPIEPEAIAQSYHSDYSGYTGVLLSVVDCSKVEAFADATTPYISKYFSKNSPIYYNEIFQYLSGGYFGLTASYPCYFDINGAMMQHLADNEYKAWKKAFDNMIYYSCSAPRWTTVYSSREYYETNQEQYGGVSMYIPRTLSKYKTFNEDFSTTAWYNRVGWDVAGW